VKDLGLISNVAAIAFGIIAGVVLFLLPVSTVETKSVIRDGTGEQVLASEVTRKTLYEEEGASVLGVLAFPVLTAAMPLAFGIPQRRWWRRRMAILSTVFSALSIFSIGAFYLPMAAAMWIAFARSPGDAAGRGSGDETATRETAPG
jgi:hypothetical protein